MSDHLPPSVLNALIDNELSPAELARVNEHLAQCPSCTAAALSTSMLKQAAAQAGRSHAPSAQFMDRLAHHSHRTPVAATTPHQHRLNWAIAAALALASVVYIATRHITRQHTIASLAHSALVSEAVDQHIAALASTVPPGVISTDQHTVKPWFQGKLPFSFNLPGTLPPATVLEGANLTYIGNQPAAELLYRIHKHRVSIFVTANNEAAAPFTADLAGFHVQSFTADHLQAVAVSDVNPTDLAALARDFQQAQQSSSSEH